MITKKDYENALKVIHAYEIQEAHRWKCDKCEYQFMNPFDQQMCQKGFDVEIGKMNTCRGRQFLKRKE